MKTYRIELTADQLRHLSQALMVYENVMIGKDYELADDTVVGATFMKVSDALEDMYADEGITE